MKYINAYLAIIAMFLLILTGCVKALNGDRYSDENHLDEQMNSENKSEDKNSELNDKVAGEEEMIGQIKGLKNQAFYEVKEIKDIVYGKGLVSDSWEDQEYHEKHLTLDLYEPVNFNGLKPAIIMVHGGGLITGSKEHGPIVSMCQYFASRGWLAVSINYRLNDDCGMIPDQWEETVSSNPLFEGLDTARAIYPAARDTKAAVRWLYAHSDEYGIDTEYISLGGGSAGAYLSIALGGTEEVDYLAEISNDLDWTLETTYPDYPSRVHTILDFWGGPGFANSIQVVYGKEVFGPDSPPILIVHGDEDKVVNYNNASRLVDIYETNGLDYELITLKGQGHSAWQAQVDGQTLEEIAFRFVVESQKLRVD